jgi:hypothetical protein
LFFRRFGFDGPSICSAVAFFNGLSLDPEIDAEKQQHWMSRKGYALAVARRPTIDVTQATASDAQKM